MPDLVSLTRPSLEILGKAHYLQILGKMTSLYFPNFGFLANTLQMKIVITLEPVMILA